MKNAKIIKGILQIGGSVLLAVLILYWMYRDFDWAEFNDAVSYQMDWTWMLLSMPFGILAQVFRGMRWRQALRPLGESPRLHSCINAVFLSYAASLVVPRIGEVLRCGVLNRKDGVSFPKSIGTVVTERVIDSLIILLLAAFALLVQMPFFVSFVRETGVSLSVLIQKFTGAGYFVTIACGLLVLILFLVLIWKLALFSKTKGVLKNLYEGIMSLRHVENKYLFFGYSIAIWLSYYLHFYLTFFCFPETSGLSSMAALVAFVVGSFAVLVPTPNGAGPWHFAVKTVLVLYGIGTNEAVIFVLVVHTLQTMLVLLLGLYALAFLQLSKTRSWHAENIE